MTTTYSQFALKVWVTRQMREDSALDVETLLAGQLADEAARQGHTLRMDTVTVTWRSHETDPLAMLGLPDDDPRREMWVRGDLFGAFVEGLTTPA